MALLCEIKILFISFFLILLLLVSGLMPVLTFLLFLLLPFPVFCIIILNLFPMIMRVNQENPFRFSTNKHLTLWQNETIAAFIHELGLVPIALVTPHIKNIIRQEWYYQFEQMRDDPDMYNNSSYFLQQCVEHWRHWRKERNFAIKHHEQFGQSGFLDELPQRTLFDEF